MDHSREFYFRMTGCSEGDFIGSHSTFSAVPSRRRLKVASELPEESKTVSDTAASDARSPPIAYGPAESFASG